MSSPTVGPGAPKGEDSSAEPLPPIADNPKTGSIEKSEPEVGFGAPKGEDSITASAAKI